MLTPRVDPLFVFHRMGTADLLELMSSRQDVKGWQKDYFEYLYDQ